MKKISTNDIINDDQYSLIRLDIDHIVMNPDKRVYVILTDGEKQAGVELNSFEASMLAFVHKGFHKNAHIHTIHQILVKFLNQIDTKIESVNIESKVGDVIYSTIKTVDVNHHRSFAISSLTDSLIVALISDAPIFCLSNVWQNMDVIDEWDYQDFIFDYDDEDEE